ncbi:hypothetical protein M9H77_18091 [Catharanthus roseus]|uniref:Uncharacterized protein n=1 Tax=Catharanthus roseus TaxID=4058 RepID=A0ACC0B6H8_CATRO|nr:hypothetical protein M9H77_18091 [Catharanthus roseus]
MTRFCQMIQNDTSSSFPWANVKSQQLLKYGNLSLIDLSVHAISGSIPDRSENFSRLAGGTPTSISNIRTLQRFAANQNDFAGNIPSGITKYLENLNLSYNNLNGRSPRPFIPTKLAGCLFSF